MSSNQEEWVAVVIIAITQQPTEVLKAFVSDKSTAGRRLVAFISVKGKGTTTTSNCL
jgi:hypothetical protein